MLEIAQLDPLRAQEIEERLTQEWWDRLQVYGQAKKKAIKALDNG